MSLVSHVLLVAFHHQHGPIVEWAHPALPTTNDGRVQLPEQWTVLLPFCALPDGAHMSQECFNAFHLPPAPGLTQMSTVFAASCYRQINASELAIKAPDVTRHTVQKAVVVLSSEPIFGAVKEKLGVVTAAFFAQRDFTSKDILVNFYDSLLPAFKKVPESSLYLGMTAGVTGSEMHALTLHSYQCLSLRSLVTDFKEKTLILFKLLFLEKRVLFHSTSIEKLIITQYSLISLMPDLMLHLRDVGSPTIEVDVPMSEAIECAIQGTRYTDPGTGASVSKSVLFEKASLPLKIFGKGSFFQPYLPLQQVDLLTSPDVKFFMVGTTNSVFKDNQALNIEAIVDVDLLTVELLGQGLSSAVSLSAPDKKWIHDLVAKVCPVTIPGDQEAPSTMQEVSYAANDDFIRSAFEHYTVTLLATVAYYNEPVQHELIKENNDPASTDNKKLLLGEYNTHFFTAWSTTRNYKRWMDTVSAEFTDVVEPSHPCHGHTTVQEYQARLQTKINEMNLDEKKEKLHQTLNAAVSTMGTYVEKVKIEAAKRVAERQATQQSKSKTSSPNKEKTSIDTEKLKQDVVEKTTQAANKARAISASLWSSASGYIASKRGENPGIHTAANKTSQAPRLPEKCEENSVTSPTDTLDDDMDSGPGYGQYQQINTTEH